MCLGVFLFGFIMYGMLWTSWTWVAITFPMLGRFSTIISSNIFSYPFFFSSSFGTPIIWMLMCLMLSQHSLRLFSFLFYFFSFILFHLNYFHHSIFQLIYPFFCFSSSLLVTSIMFLISVIALFIADWLWVGLDHWLVKVSWLEELVLCSGGWRWISSLWMVVKCSVVSFGCPWFWADSLLMAGLCSSFSED